MVGRLSTIIFLAVLVAVMEVNAYRKRQTNERQSEAALKSQETSEHQKEGILVTTNGTAQTNGTLKTHKSEVQVVMKTQVDEIEASGRHEGKKAMGERWSVPFFGSNCRMQAVSLLVTCVGISSAAFNIL
eukprot:TRINITY_DN6789_c0_g1_i1.p1 TRINITY_DN6789_c0_g1~~TRINITY_DN6789_c0_g1_i1.p1  ORF type:complete len:130 (+),score=28.44 TRINITY_DN6789_c0_g1_i1:58-447(+)